jgi:predicted amidohydrolase
MKTKIRIGGSQFMIRSYNINALMDYIEQAVKDASAQQADFLFFPELFSLALMEEWENLPGASAIRMLAKHSPVIQAKAKELAVSNGVNIIAGSLPVEENGNIYNIAYLCRRDGTISAYRKVHLTPTEKGPWAFSAGNEIPVFETDCGIIGIAICYDSEFPELARLMTKQGAKLLFVPYLTDSLNGFNRVNYCAHARAVENECYVAITGCCGGFPAITDLESHYAHSGIFSPSDHFFPADAIIAAAPPNTDAIFYATLDLELLEKMNESGSVHTVTDRRTDLYDVVIKKQ